MSGTLRALVGVGLLAAMACGTGMVGQPRGVGSVSELTELELERTTYVDLYEAISSLRSQWLRLRGPTSFNNEGELLVYLDGQRLGGVEQLRSVSTQSVRHVKLLSPGEAQARFGLGHPHGAIAISSR